MVLLDIPACLADGRTNLSTFEAPAILPFPPRADQQQVAKETGGEAGQEEGEACTIRGWSRGLLARESSRSQERGNDRGPILVLLHGYPQTNYMWRHFVKLLPPSARLFVPDLPGYGSSSPLRTASHDKRTVGRAILSSLHVILTTGNHTTNGEAQDIILIGHDRGARVSHRLAVDAGSYAEVFRLRGVVLIDIVPTAVQWRGMADPREAARFWHWPFLANVELATEMLMVGDGREGARFAPRMIERLAGNSERGRQRLRSDGALEVYETAFRRESVVRASCRDYEAGAGADVEQQRADQEAGRRIGVPVLALYGDALGRRFDVEREWRGWVAREELLRAEGMAEGIGHHLVEEDPEGAYAAFAAWTESALGWSLG